MKAANKLTAELGQNMAESMGVRSTRPAAAVPSALASPRYKGVTRDKAAEIIPVDRIDRDPSQPREEFDPEALQRLADSFTEYGQFQPIRCRFIPETGRFMVLFGERRWRAAQLAGMTTIRAEVLEADPTPDERLAMQLEENLQREGLSALEFAKALQTYKSLTGISDRQLAGKLHLSQPTISRALALLELPHEIQAKVEAGELAPATAYEVSRLPADEQAEAAAQIIEGGLTRAEATQVVKRRTTGKTKAKGVRTAHTLGGPVRMRMPELGVVVSVDRIRGKRPLGPDEIRAALEKALTNIDAANSDAA
jgi:ParB family chromosome partitioning protein